MEISLIAHMLIFMLIFLDWKQTKGNKEIFNQGHVYTVSRYLPMNFHNSKAITKSFENRARKNTAGHFGIVSLDWKIQHLS